MTTRELPLFPLHSVLFPGGPLALRIFEPRYLDMVGQSIKDDQPFGICLIAEGDEIGEPAFTYDVGTQARVRYWHRRGDGMLGVTVIGETRFRILERRVEPNHLVVAQVVSIPNDPELVLPVRYAALAEVLREMMEQLDHPYIHLPKRYDDASWVGGRLCELLPLPLEQKQLLLQLLDPVERLERLHQIVENGKLV